MRNFLKMTSFKINWGHRGHWGQSKQKFTKSEKLVILIVNLMDNVPEKSVLRKKGDKSGTRNFGDISYTFSSLSPMSPMSPICF